MGALQGVPDIFLDFEPDIGWFLLVRIFNNEVSDAERLCAKRSRCPKYFHQRESLTPCLPLSLKATANTAQTYFMHHPCSFIRIDRMSVINRNWRFTPIARSEFQSILRHSHPPLRHPLDHINMPSVDIHVMVSWVSKCPRSYYLHMSINIFIFCTSGDTMFTCSSVSMVTFFSPIFFFPP